MKTFSKYSLHILIWCIAVIGLSSCEHKDLCYDHVTKVKARIDVDWSLFTQETPTGMSVMLYSLDDDDRSTTTLSNDISHAEVNVYPGAYFAMVFNQSVNEFGSLGFVNIDDRNNAAVYAAERTSKWYKTQSTQERVVQNPEWFAVGTQALVKVSDDDIRKHTSTGLRSVIATITPRCVVYTIHVKIHVKNAYNIRSARATLNGLADGYQLCKMLPSPTVATQIIDEWTLIPDDGNPANGTLYATITSFGLPYGHRNVADANHLDLSLLLVDGKTQCHCDFAVGDAFKPGENAELSLTLDESIAEPIPDVKPEGGSSSGFDVTVRDWDDGADIDINA